MNHHPLARLDTNDATIENAVLSLLLLGICQTFVGAVRARLGWRRTGFTINFPWEVSLDHFFWAVQ